MHPAQSASVTLAFVLPAVVLIAACSGSATSAQGPSSPGQSAASRESRASPAASSAESGPAVPPGSACGIFTISEESAILGQPVKAFSDFTPGDSGCAFTGGPLRTQGQVVAGLQLDCGGQNAAGQWALYVSSGVVIQKTPLVRSISKPAGYNDAVRLRNGCVLSATAGFTLAAKPVPGTARALLAAIDAAYPRDP
jgi:hypothetical protein